MTPPITPPTNGPATTANKKYCRTTPRGVWRQRRAAQIVRLAPTSGSTVFAAVKPITIVIGMWYDMSTENSAIPNASRNTGHVRRGVNSSVATVSPAGGKNEAPASDALRYLVVRIAPTAYRPPTNAAHTRTRQPRTVTLSRRGLA